MSPLQERPETSCRVLLDILAKTKDMEKKQLLLDDIVWKCRALPSEYRFLIEREALKEFVPEEVAKCFKERNLEMTRTPVDVAVITVVPPELDAVKIAFGIGFSAKEDNNINGLRFWNTSVEMQEPRTDLSVVLTMIGEAGNVSCAAACDRLFNSYDADLCILVGIAAGLKQKVDLGDVVAADIILDYEKARLEEDGSKKRPVQYSSPLPIARDMNYFSPERFGWRKALERCMPMIQAIPDVQLPDWEKWVPKYRNGVILSGEKLIADGAMDERRAEYHERIRAAEMEGVGFARLCQEHDVPWLVLRGISDYGDPNKSDLWQLTSAVSAATAAKIFLENSYRKPQKK